MGTWHSAGIPPFSVIASLIRRTATNRASYARREIAWRRLGPRRPSHQRLDASKSAELSSPQPPGQHRCGDLAPRWHPASFATNRCWPSGLIHAPDSGARSIRQRTQPSAYGGIRHPDDNGDQGLAKRASKSAIHVDGVPSEACARLNSRSDFPTSPSEQYPTMEAGREEPAAPRRGLSRSSHRCGHRGVPSMQICKRIGLNLLQPAKTRHRGAKLRPRL
jgi:hypothetical protein